ncbi:MAG: prolyl oligopeptidase family serine peptidase [Armatimonadetes bacterium]|nr:prolyl oligopeptidase family serine peptidase [Armatimonadota bacterium]
MPSSRVVRIVIALVLGSIAAVSRGQDTPPVDGPVPHIDFGVFRQVAQGEYYEEHTTAFPSALTTGVTNNDEVRLRVFLPTDRVGPVPVVVLLHFWGATDNMVELEMAERLAVRGVASVVMPLPYHLGRTPPGMKSGELAVQPDPVKLRQTMTQAVLDVRRTVDWIETRNEFKKGAVSVAGTSLGSLVAELAFAVEPRFQCGVFMLGGSDLAGILWSSSRVVQHRETLRHNGYTEAKLRQELVPVEPNTYLKLEDKRPTFVVRARQDTVIPPATSQSLVDHLGNTKVLFLETGHYGGFLVQARLIDTVTRFLDATFNGKEFVVPTKFYSPTVRLGLVADTTQGLQVGVGLDVWRSNVASDAFATVFLAPKGLSVFVGHKVNQGLSLGAVAMPRRAAIGLVWSVVF